jgi:hypothetical protein
MALRKKRSMGCTLLSSFPLSNIKYGRYLMAIWCYCFMSVLTSILGIYLNCSNSLVGCSWMAPPTWTVIVTRELTCHHVVLSACTSELYFGPFHCGRNWDITATLQSDLFFSSQSVYVPPTRGGIKWGARLELCKIIHRNFQKDSGKNKTPSPALVGSRLVPTWPHYTKLSRVSNTISNAKSVEHLLRKKKRKKKRMMA